MVKDTNELAKVIHEAFHVATKGRPGPVLVDIPKDVQFATSEYIEKSKIPVSHYQPKIKGDTQKIARLVDAIENAKKAFILHRWWRD